MNIEKDELQTKGNKARKTDKDKDKDMEEFMEELEQNKALRSKVNLIRDEKVIEELEKKKAKKSKMQKGGNQMTSEPTPAEAKANPTIWLWSKRMAMMTSWTKRKTQK
eukprot:GABU01005028.1.p2 GENE.GABU01005028.1~~GABU01005028.1.p2  ORF type:complete len:108 (+),score=58.47 GABU01005028.1:446-769(+)